MIHRKDDWIAVNKWETLSSELALEHPRLRVTLDTLLLPNGDVIDDWPTVHAGDYVNALIVNSDGDGLILEGYQHGLGRTTWQLIGGNVQEDEDPFTAIQRELTQSTGYACRKWQHLSSFVVDGNRHVGTAHFFLGYGPQMAGLPFENAEQPHQLKWIPIKELKIALWDGRISIMSYGINVALALLALDV